MKQVVCPSCKKEAPCVENKEKYGINYGKSYMCYYCKKCDTYVGCHNNSKRPLGTMAGKELREWRKKAHRIIDYSWKSGKISRGLMYGKLRKFFGREVHIGESDMDTCKTICDKFQEIIK